MRLKVFDIGGRDGVPETVHDRVLTVPNAITAVRLASLPLLAWLVLGPRRLVLAFALLTLVAGTDWVDGYVARRFDQVSRVGKMLDPLVDRVLVATAALTMLAAGILPAWLVAAVVGRDLALGVAAFALLGHLPEIAVTRTGKFATSCLLIGLPLALLGAAEWSGAEALAVAAWGFLLLGLAAYYAAGTQYVRLFVRLRGEGGDPGARGGR